MLPGVVNLAAKLDMFSEHWAPKTVAQMNGYGFKLVKVEGDFVWHAHENTDEVFIVLDGELRIDFRDGAVTLGAGEMTVVPKCTEHKPFAESECHLMLVEPTGVLNAEDASTAAPEEWI